MSVRTETPRTRAVPRHSVLIGVVVAACGCAELFTAHRVERQHDAGSVHFAVLAVGPWSEFAESLQPSFQIDEQSALDQVVPSTRALEESLLSVLQASLGLTDVPSRVVDSTTTTTTPDATSERTVTEREASPLRSEVRPDAAVVIADDRAVGLPRDSVLDQDVGIDPMMRYWAATALYQEVNLLNQYIRTAAIRDGFRPYVVRLQVTLMPAARNEPYDVYTTFSFFSRPLPVAGRGAGGTGGPGAPETSLRGTIRGSSTASERLTPQIIPLMATDNLEATMHSRMVDNVRQLAGALFFMSGTATGALDGQQFSRDQQGVLGRDLNSLLTVARVSDNSLRVRLGASQQATSDYAMVPRNHNVTVLVMVPEGVADTIQIVSRTVLVDAKTGKELKERTSEEISAILERVRDRYDLAADEKELLGLLAFAQHNDQRAYFAELERLAGPDRDFAHGTSLWLDLVSLMAGSRYSATEFDLPPPVAYAGNGFSGLPDQKALLLDDGVLHSTIVLRGGSSLKSSEVSAILEVRPADGEMLPFVPDQVAVSSDRGDIYLEFPSLRAWGVTSGGFRGTMSLTVECRGESTDLEVKYLARPEAPKAEKP